MKNVKIVLSLIINVKKTDSTERFKPLPFYVPFFDSRGEPFTYAYRKWLPFHMYLQWKTPSVFGGLPI